MRPAWAMLLLGCGGAGGDSGADPRRAFAEGVAGAGCALYDECGLLDHFGGTREGCEAQLFGALLDHVTDPACAFDAAAADDCLAAYEAATCSSDGAPDADARCSAVCGG